MALPWSHCHHHQRRAEHTTQDASQKELMGFGRLSLEGRVLIRLVSHELCLLFYNMYVAGPHSQAGETWELSFPDPKALQRCGKQ